MKEFNGQKLLKEYSVLYVEDNREISEEIAFFLESQFKDFYVAYDGVEGLELFERYKPDIIISDIQMPRMNGIDMIQKVREIDMEVSIIITTAFNESKYLLQAIEMQVDAYLMKPLNMKELIKKIHKLIRPKELEKELHLKNRELTTINSNLDEIVRDKTKELEYLYTHDALTGLENFTSLVQEIESNEYNYIVLLDISNFSLVNKLYGKNFANKILQKTAEVLQNHTNLQNKIYKAESDRFVFILKESQSDKVEYFCQQIIGFFDTKNIEVEGLGIYINFSMGVALIEKESFTIVNAELALENAKRIGSRYYHFYEEGADGIENIKEFTKKLDSTREMIKNDSLEPFYQPIVDLKTGKIVKYEVLARGNYEGKFLSPYYFLSQAQTLGILSSITRIMVKKSFAYFQNKEVSFSINITQRDLLDKYLILFLQEKLDIYNIKASRVTFEILENVTLGKEQAVILQQLASLKKMGFTIAIDDFGIENSNFSRLLDIDFDYIKLDGLFIKGLLENKKDRIVISAIVNMAKTLGIKTIAEYVHSQEIYDIIKASGVDMAQGEYIGKALPTLLEENNCE